jgi:hypothetical protein
MAANLTRLYRPSYNMSRYFDAVGWKNSPGNLPERIITVATFGVFRASSAISIQVVGLGYSI